MKRILLITILYLFSFNPVTAQHSWGYINVKEIKKDKRKYIPGKIILENGNEINALVENVLRTFKDKLDFSKLKYKTNKESKYKTISIKKIKELILFVNESSTFKGIKLKAYSMNLKQKLVRVKDIVLPLMRDGKIQLYGIDYIVDKRINGISMYNTYSNTTMYIKNKDQEFAYIPVDYDRIGIFNSIFATKKVILRFFNIFEKVGSDCPEFVKFLEGEKKKVINKEEMYSKRGSAKAYKKNLNDRKKFINSTNDSLTSPRDERDKILVSKRDLSFYQVLKYIRLYEKLCREKKKKQSEKYLKINQKTTKNKVQ